MSTAHVLPSRSRSWGVFAAWAGILIILALSFGYIRVDLTALKDLPSNI